MAVSDLTFFSRRVATLRERVRRLFQSAHAGVSSDLLALAFDELQHALDELQVAEDALRAQDQQRHEAQTALDAERRHYADLFERAPVAYLVTSAEGTIRQANQPAADLLRTQGRQLIGRSLALFIPDGSRRAFRSRIPLLCQQEGPSEWYTQLQPADGPAIDVLLLVVATSDTFGRTVALRWLIHRLAAQSIAELTGYSRAELERRIAQLDSHGELLRDYLRSLEPHAGDTALKERAVGM